MPDLAPGRRRRAYAAPGTDRRSRPRNGPRACRASARPRRHKLRRGTAAAAPSLCCGTIRRCAWILGRGWNQELWADQALSRRRPISMPQCRDRPVVLERVDGHAVVANSAALKAAGITAATKDPVGGKIERDASGNPTGLLVDAATELVNSKVPAPSADAARAGARQGAGAIALGRRDGDRRHGHVRCRLGGDEGCRRRRAGSTSGS